MKIEVLGASGCKRCSNLKDDIERTVEDMGLSDEVQVEKVDDFSELANRGIMETPAVVVDGELKFKGRVPDKKEIRGILE